ncbi:energy transducer TonB family protein [Marinobacter subterrani]|uniref:TonB family C-terminal domain n=1 Tax=Marinobacter subterrani TaxID=1658765 RepID=A0A0J7JBC2_9GAMM|nr:TonB family protein [Marinobacter subterrani]KMQ75209.1 TonB family C-terminal domain [Marinobacter subterrani]
MVEEGNTSAVPARYRIGLALSLALMFHTLVLSGLPSPVTEQKVEHRQSLEFELITPGTDQTARPAPDANATSRPIPLIPRFSAEPASEPVVTRQAPESPRVPEPVISEPPAQKPETTEATRQSSPSHSARAGEVTRTETQETEATITRITNSPVEQDPYVVTLATHLGHQLEQARVPAMRALSRIVSMEVELQLLDNGALTRARVLKSTGIDGIDEAAYRAALAASPYPRPPEGENSQNRFEVELVFTPKRL